MILPNELTKKCMCFDILDMLTFVCKMSEKAIGNESIRLIELFLSFLPNDDRMDTVWNLKSANW